jgi:ATP phosphoribosyltransferase
MGFLDTLSLIRFALPKGRMQENLLRLLSEAGVRVRLEPRGYRASLLVPGFETKLLKPQNIVEMLHAGSRDLGFAGADWVEELGADVEELVDTGLDPVRLVAAAPRSLLVDGALPARPLVVASEYEGVTRRWIRERGLDARFVRSFGATEVFPPEDADCIVDNTATGSTLRANDLLEVETLATSSTRLYANRRALEDPEKAERIRRFALLVQSAVEARRRVMIEINTAEDVLAAVVDLLPCMREPTVAPLHAGTGYSVKAAVPRADLPDLLPRIKAVGGTDIVVSEIAQIVA